MTTRDQIVETADRLFHERGFDHTSFTDIAAEVGISRGNFYYHFKAKDEILDAVIVLRVAKIRAMLDRWETEAEDPAARIEAFIGMLIMNSAKIIEHGCPVGSLCAELAKLDHAALGDAKTLFTLFRDWLARQFASLGRTTEADSLAMHLLARSQGIATLANAFHDETFIRQEVAQMRSWLHDLSGG